MITWHRLQSIQKQTKGVKKLGVWDSKVNKEEKF